MAETVGSIKPEAVVLDAPKSTPFTVKELAQYDGTSDLGIYVAIKGDIFDGKCRLLEYMRERTSSSGVLSLDSLC